MLFHCSELLGKPKRFLISTNGSQAFRSNGVQGLPPLLILQGGKGLGRITSHIVWKSPKSILENIQIHNRDVQKWQCPNRNGPELPNRNGPKQPAPPMHRTDRARLAPPNQRRGGRGGGGTDLPKFSFPPSTCNYNNVIRMITNKPLPSNERQGFILNPKVERA